MSNPVRKLLSRITHLEFVASSKSSTGWNGRGVGAVEVEILEDTLLFKETGKWFNEQGRSFPFKNIYRWTFKDKDTAISLEHLRLGKDKAVQLFEMRPKTNRLWSSVFPHKCRQDFYSAVMRIDDAVIFLDWEVTGAKKAEKIKYKYFM